MPRRLLCLLFSSILLLVVPISASADKLTQLTRRLSTNHGSKVRMSAALGLAKMSSRRAPLALARALTRDPSPTVRRIAAVSLGRWLRTHQKARANKHTRRVRKKAVAALLRSAKRDQDTRVRHSANESLALAGDSTGHELPASSFQQKPIRGIMVGVALPRSLSKNLPRHLARLMQTIIKQVIDDQAPPFLQTASGSQMPTRANLQNLGMTGYAVVPKISKISLSRNGKHLAVQCEVKLRLTPWDGSAEKWVADNTATAVGSGTIPSGRSKAAISDSSQKCIKSVVAQMTAAQVVPFLSARER